MFVQSIKFVEAHSGNKKKVSIYGQEYTNTTFKLAKMNLAIRGISANLGEMAANTFTNDQHKDLKADYIMANPPFNQKEWRADNELIDDPRWNGYEVPPISNANYGWILNIVSKLSQNGVAGFLLANGALSDDGTELKIREQLIRNNLVEAIGNDHSLVHKADFVSPIKSVGHGITTVEDLEENEQVWSVFLELTQDIGHKLRVHQKCADGVAIHIRDNTLFSKQWQISLDMPTQSPMLIAKTAFNLFEKKYDWKNPIRSVTIQAINLVPQDTPRQVDFFTNVERIEKLEKLDLTNRVTSD